MHQHYLAFGTVLAGLIACSEAPKQTRVTPEQMRAANLESALKRAGAPRIERPAAETSCEKSGCRLTRVLATPCDSMENLGLQLDSRVTPGREKCRICDRLPATCSRQ